MLSWLYYRFCGRGTVLTSWVEVAATDVVVGIVAWFAVFCVANNRIRFARSFSAILRTCCSDRRRFSLRNCCRLIYYNAIWHTVVRLFSCGVAPSNTKMGLICQKSSLQILLNKPIKWAFRNILPSPSRSAFMNTFNQILVSARLVEYEYHIMLYQLRVSCVPMPPTQLFCQLELVVPIVHVHPWDRDYQHTAIYAQDLIVVVTQQKRCCCGGKFSLRIPC